MSLNKRAYFQGGGGVNEPTPGQKKYKSDPAIVVQPRFEEPFYRNYDLYTIPGMEHIGPGTGYHGLQNYKSVQEFLDARRQRLKPRYVADDSWQVDSGERVKKTPERKARMAIFEKIVKQARMPGMGLIHQLQNKFKDKNEVDENDGPNFDYGDGAYTAMSEGKKMKSITDAPHNSPGAFFADDNEDHMLPPKEHGTSIYDWKNSIYQGKPKAPPKSHDSHDNNYLGYGFYENLEHYKSVKDFIQNTPLGYKHPAKIKPEKERAKDVNNIDFPIDDMVNRQDQMIYPIEDEYEIRREKGDRYIFPSDGSGLDPADLNISMTSPQIAGEHSYLPDADFADRSDEALNFGRDYDDEPGPGRLTAAEVTQKLLNKYLAPSETGLFGLPDGVDPEGHDADQTEQVEEPYTGTSDISTQMYDDKWNI